jgi:4-hydroxybenzoate polyprenyltransferase
MSMIGISLQNRRQGSEKMQVSFLRSQLALLQSRKKWGLLYSLATVAGLFCIPGIAGSVASETEIPLLTQRILPLPFISLLIATGMYILNDLVDSDLDRANGKKRPIPSGVVSKNQAWVFILWTNALAVLLSIVTFNIMSVIMVVPMLAIGSLYSAPRVALADKFVIKTLSIAVFYMLCAVLGITSSYGIELAAASPVVPIYAMLMLGMMIFISSVFNDLGDVKGDKAAGRRTIPIVIGRTNTVKMSMALVSTMAAISWATFAVGETGLITAILTSSFSLIVAIRMTKSLKGLDDMEFMRKEHKKIFPLHLILQSSLVIGILLI